MGFVGKGLRENQSLMGVWLVKVYLTDGQALCLLCIGGRCNLNTVRAIQSTENAMTIEILTVRVAQALLAVTATAASVLVVQFAMLVG